VSGWLGGLLPKPPLPAFAIYCVLGNEPKRSWKTKSLLISSINFGESIPFLKDLTFMKILG
jgi:hypothetical protein